MYAQHEQNIAGGWGGGKLVADETLADIYPNILTHHKSSCPYHLRQ